MIFYCVCAGPRPRGWLPATRDVSNYVKTTARLFSSVFCWATRLPWSYSLQGFTSRLITYSRSIWSFLRAVFYCSFFKDTLLAPDARFLFHPASPFLETQPEILLGNLIPKRSNTVKAGQFTLLSSFNQAPPQDFPQQFIDSSRTQKKLAKDTQKPQKTFE